MGTINSYPSLPGGVASGDAVLVGRNGIAFSYPATSFGTPYTYTPGASFSTLSTLRVLATQARNSNPHVLTTVATPPTISLSSTNTTSSYPNGYYWTGTYQNVFNYYGGTGSTPGGTRRFYSGTLLSGANINNGGRVQWVSDSAKFVIWLNNGQTTSYFRLIIDGQYVQSAGYSLSASGACFVTVDFTSAGGRQVRDFIIELDPTSQWRGVYVSATEGVYKPATPVLRAAIMGDNFLFTGATAIGDCFGSVLCDYLGIADFWNMGVTGAGYLSTAGGTQWTARQSLANVAAASPDILMVAYGHYDNGYTPASVTAEVTAFLTALRLIQPAIPVYIFGVMSGAQNADGTMLATENAISAGVTAYGDAHTFFIPVTSDPNGAWMTGTGYSGSTNGSGNSDVYVSSDGVDPSLAGHAFLAAQFSNAIIRGLKSIGQ